MYRKLVISTNINNIDKFNNLNNLLNNAKIKDLIADRNIFIKIKDSTIDNLRLYGYDKELKYQTNTISYNEFIKIFNIIDQMPMRKQEILSKSLNGGDMKLYTDDNPLTTLKGTGFKDKEKALETIKLISNRSLPYQKSVINTMYYRAKHHPAKTPAMTEAMHVFKKWLQENKNKTIKYDYLDLHIVKKYEKLANYYNISHVARGLKKAVKTDKGFLVVYKKYNKNKLPFIPVFKKKPEGMDYDIYREKFINSRLGQMKAGGTKLYTKEGLPTKQHVILIMHAYSPDKKGIINKLKLLDTL